MNSKSFDDLLNRYLDGELTPDEKQEFQKILLSNPDAQLRFWHEAQLHGALRLLTEQESGDREARKEFALAQKTKVIRPRRFWLGAAASAAAAVVAVFLGSLLTRPLSASDALQQVIAATSDAGDRTYSITVLKGNSVRPITGGRALTLKGAVVHLRGKDRYVIIQDLVDDDRQRITGFDGKQSWSFIGRGAVNVSEDPRRFRSNLPGSQHDFAFTNLHDELEKLGEDYDILLGDTNGSGLQSLSATKKSREVRGPREVGIWFDPDSGTIQKLELYGLPQGKGGPQAIRLELVDQPNLGPEFFSHSAHHEEGRTVRENPMKRK